MLVTTRVNEEEMFINYQLLSVVDWNQISPHGIYDYLCMNQFIIYILFMVFYSFASKLDFGWGRDCMLVHSIDSIEIFLFIPYMLVAILGNKDSLTIRCQHVLVTYLSSFAPECY
jgi:hypothetical protein